MQLLANCTKNFTSNAYHKVDNVNNSFIGTGVFNGATLTLYYSPDNGVTFLTAATLTAPGRVDITGFNYGQFSASVSSAGTSTNINAYIV